MVNMTDEGLEIIEEFERVMLRLDQLEDIREEIKDFQYTEYIRRLEEGEINEDFEVDETKPEYQGVENIQDFLIRRRIEAMEDMLEFGFQTEKPINMYRGLVESKTEPDNEELMRSGFIFLVNESPLIFVCEDEGDIYINEALNELNFTLLVEYSIETRRWKSLRKEG